DDFANAQTRTVYRVEYRLMLDVFRRIDDGKHLLLAQGVRQIPAALGARNRVILTRLPQRVLIITLYGIDHHILLLLTNLVLLYQLKNKTLNLLFGERGQITVFKIRKKLG